MTRARDIADQQDNLGGAVAPFVAGKNALNNGGMDIWQRGTTFTNGGQYTADRWFFDVSASTVTSTREATIVPAGFQYSWKINKSAGSATATLMGQTIETANAVQFAGKTVTVSYYAAADAATTFGAVLTFSTAVDNPRTGSWTVISPTVNGATSVSTTSFVRIVSTFAVPSTAKSLFFYIEPAVASGANIYVTGFQLEHGSAATPFARSGGSIGGELALCQRYYWRQTATGSAYTGFGTLLAVLTNTAQGSIPLPVALRVPAISVEYSTLATYDNTIAAVTQLTLVAGATASPQINVNSTTYTQFRPYQLLANNSTSAYLAFNAEL
jgi:hypothetical protein